jgi:gamma-glutamyl-gamma-aminobutyrate hydrolase PuuD
LLDTVVGDGTIEAIRIVNVPGFALGVQRLRTAFDPQHSSVNRALFEAFG